MDPNNEIILKITRKFENIIDKVLKSEKAKVVLQEIEVSKSKEEKVVEYHKPNLVAEKMREEIEKESIGVIKNKLEGASDLDSFLNLI